MNDFYGRRLLSDAVLFVCTESAAKSSLPGERLRLRRGLTDDDDMLLYG